MRTQTQLLSLPNNIHMMEKFTKAFLELLQINNVFSGENCIFFEEKF